MGEKDGMIKCEVKETPLKQNKKVSKRSKMQKSCKKEKLILIKKRRRSSLIELNKQKMVKAKVAEKGKRKKSIVRKSTEIEKDTKGNTEEKFCEEKVDLEPSI